MFSNTHDPKFQTQSLPDTQLTNTIALIKGGIIDDDIDALLPKNFYSDYTEQFVIVSYMNFTAIQIAAELATRQQCLLTPEVMFIDDSRLAVRFWIEFVQFTHNHADLSTFLYDLKMFLRKYMDFICPSFFSLEKKEHYVVDSYDYIKSIFEKYDYNYLRILILKVQYIKQKWLNPETANGLQKYFDENNYRFTFYYSNNQLIPTYDANITWGRLEENLKRKVVVIHDEKDEKNERDERDDKEERADERHVRFGM